jgi:hypothetical protein
MAVEIRTGCCVSRRSSLLQTLEPSAPAEHARNRGRQVLPANEARHSSALKMAQAPQILRASFAGDPTTIRHAPRTLAGHDLPRL